MNFEEFEGLQCKLTPDLNYERRFLRGGHDSDQLKVEEDTVVSHSHTVKDKFFLGHWGTDCPVGSVKLEDINVDNAGPYDDKICERETGNSLELKKQNLRT